MFVSGVFGGTVFSCFFLDRSDVGRQDVLWQLGDVFMFVQTVNQSANGQTKSMSPFQVPFKDR